MTLVLREVRQPKDIHRAFKSLTPRQVDAVLTLTDALLSSGRTDIVYLASNSRLPGIYHLRDFVAQGGINELRSRPASHVLSCHLLRRSYS